MNLPIAVQRRLDDFAEAARVTRTSRNELLAALIATTAVDKAVLSELVLRYREMTIGEVLDDGADQDDVVVPLRQPGRPRSANSG